MTTHIQDPLRLAALREAALLDSPEEEAFDRLTRLAARFANAPVALVTLIDSDRQFFKSCLGLPPELQELRETPLDLSFCQYNRFAGRPMVVGNALTHPVLRENPATEILPLIAYLGFPLVTADNQVLGALCVIDTRPRSWTDDEIAAVEELARATMDEIRLRTEIQKRELAETRNQELGELSEHSDKLHQTQKMEAIGRLAGGVAHDLNNLLTPILGHTESLLDEPQISSRQRRSLDEVFQASLRARDLVKKLLAIGRKQRLELRSIDLNTVIRGVEGLLQRTIPEDVRVFTDLAPNLRPVLADVGEGNGRELFERCAELRPGLKVLYMSGYAHHFVKRHGALETRDQLIEKPFSSEELLRRIRELL